MENNTAEKIEVMHYHAIVSNVGIVAKLPAVASKKIALETLIYWIGPRISPMHVAKLMDGGVASGTGLGTVCIVDCDCKDSILTQSKLEEILHESSII